MISRIGIYVIVGFTAFLFACQRNQKETLKIAYASNMQYVIKDLAEEFSKIHSIECDLIKGSSGRIYAQIKQGAPYDIFISANTLYPQKLSNDDLLLSFPLDFAIGQLILWSSKKIDSMSLINHSKIGIPNPKFAPYGMAASIYLKNTNQLSAIKQKLIYAESVSQVNQFINTKSVDIGFTSQSVLYSKIKDKGYWEYIDPDLYPPIKHSIAILKKNSNLEMSQIFLEFMFSEEAESILKSYGYLTVKNKL